jgi:hypothetical protein
MPWYDSYGFRSRRSTSSSFRPDVNLDLAIAQIVSAHPLSSPDRGGVQCVERADSA